jgi:hypothetical protein
MMDFSATITLSVMLVLLTSLLYPSLSLPLSSSLSSLNYLPLFPLSIISILHLPPPLSSYILSHQTQFDVSSIPENKARGEERREESERGVEEEWRSERRRRRRRRRKSMKERRR